jgi:hypothetical protein
MRISLLFYFKNKIKKGNSIFTKTSLSLHFIARLAEGSGYGEDRVRTKSKLFDNSLL